MSTNGDVRQTIAIESTSRGEFADGPIVPEASVVESAVTDDRPAQVELSLANQADDPWTGRRTVCPPADAHVAARTDGDVHTDGDARLVLLLADEQSFEPANPDCWRPRFEDFDVGAPCGPEEVTIPAGETVVRTYEVWDHPKNEDCMPPGEYEFGETYQVDDREIEWRFTLAVESH